MPTISDIDKLAKQINWKKEWKNNKKFMGNIFIDFRKKIVIENLPTENGQCKGVYTLSDGEVDKTFELYCGVSEKGDSTCRKRAMSHRRSVERFMTGSNVKDNESSGKKIVEYYKDKDYAILNVHYMDLDKYETLGLKLLAEANMIPALKGPLNDENKKNRKVA